jgi:hypothetical protein
LAPPTLIYCAGRNKRLDQIALDAGYRLGCQLPNRFYHNNLYFADQDWKHPNRPAYMQALNDWHPTMATVLDWEQDEQLPEVLEWAEEAAQHTDHVLIVPKIPGSLSRIPRQIDGVPVILAYSVPTKYGGSEVPLWEFAGWPVHLLGGSPHKQMEIWRYLSNIADIISIDGNMANKMATQYCAVWIPPGQKPPNPRDGRWPKLKSLTGHKVEQDAPYKAFHLSCQNIGTAWNHLCQ